MILFLIFPLCVPHIFLLGYLYILEHSIRLRLEKNNNNLFFYKKSRNKQTLNGIIVYFFMSFIL